MNTIHQNSLLETSIVQSHQENLMQMINQCPDLLIWFFDTTIDTLQNIDYVFNNYPTPTLVNALKQSQNPTVLRVENHRPICVTEGLCGNIKININDKTPTGKAFPTIIFERKFSRYLRLRLFNNITYPVSVPIKDFPLKIRDDIENNPILNMGLSREDLATKISQARQQYGWHSRFAYHNGYELAMYDPRSPYGRERLKLTKDCISELIKIRDFIQDYVKQSKFETPLSETVVFNTQ